MLCFAEFCSSGKLSELFDTHLLRSFNLSSELASRSNTMQWEKERRDGNFG